jgi:hypothetical protein
MRSNLSKREATKQPTSESVIEGSPPFSKLYQLTHTLLSVLRVYLSRWDPRECAEPEPGNEQKSRDWIRSKYIDKRWYASRQVASGWLKTAKVILF